jgi:Carboxypeptidase regulatory-like domain
MPLLLLLHVGAVSAAVTPALPGSFEKAYISGTVTSDGAPVAGASVMAVGEDGTALAVTAPNGHYALGVGKGTWKVAVSRERYAAVRPKSVEVAAEAEQTPVDFALKPSNAQIDGVVVDEAGRPLPLAMVMVVPNFFDRGHGGGDDEDVPPSTAMTPGGFPLVCADAHGAFVLHVTAGSFLLPAYKGGYTMSSTNPRPTIPGMENLPPEMLARTPQLTGCGVPVRVAEGEHKTEVRIVLAPDPSKREQGPAPDVDPGAGVQEKPQVNVLVGRACLSPCNVLHWSRKAPGPNAAFCVVSRDGKPLAGFDPSRPPGSALSGMLQGRPASGYHSFTDATAQPGVAYRYTVREIGASGLGPASNEVVLTTR